MKVTNNAPLNPQIIERSKSTDKALAPERAVAATEPKAVSKHGSLVEISDDAQLMKKAAEIAGSVPDIRQDKVQKLKKLIEEGKYKVDAAEVADRLLKEHLNTDFGKNNL